jgi:hypothetical protein
MPIYTVYLSTQVSASSTSAFNPIIPINDLSNNNVSWNIDWSNVFKGDEKNYKFCRVRYHLISETFPSAVSAWNNMSGYLSCNLASRFGSTGIGTILGLIYPQDCFTTGTATHIVIVNTMAETGVDINIPSVTNNIFTLQFMNDDSLTRMSTFNSEYQILLSFELYN